MDSEGQKPIKVYLVNPPIQDPWRTQGEYRDEQKRTRRLYVVALVSSIVSALGAVGTSVSAAAALKSATAVPQTVRVECVAPAPALPASSTTVKPRGITRP